MFEFPCKVINPTSQGHFLTTNLWQWLIQKGSLMMIFYDDWRKYQWPMLVVIKGSSDMTRSHEPDEAVKLLPHRYTHSSQKLLTQPWLLYLHLIFTKIVCTKYANSQHAIINTEDINICTLQRVIVNRITADLYRLPLYICAQQCKQ